MPRQEPTTIAFLGGGNPVVANTLALLLEGVGYDTKILEGPSAERAGEQLNGVDLLLLPAWDGRNREGSLGAIEAIPATADVPVLTLSAASKEEPKDRTGGMMPWHPQKGKDSAP